MPSKEVRKPWAIGEIKEALLFAYVNYLEKYNSWLKGVQRIESPTATRKEFISAFATFYHICEAYYLKDFEEVKKELKLSDIKKEDYDDMLFDNIDDRRLFKLSKALNHWNYTYGFFRVYDTTTEYDDIQEQANAEEGF